MRRRFVLYTGSCVGALIAAGIAWAWSGSRPTPVPSPSRSTPPVRQHPARPVSLAPPKVRAERAPEPAASAEAPALPELSDVAREVPVQSAPASALTGAPASDDSAGDQSAAAEPLPGVPDDTAEAPPGPARPRTREVSLTRLRLWSQPGMCAATGDALSARQILSARFRYWEGGELGLFHVDPRLPLDAPTPILGYIAEAEHEVARRLKLSVARPETFLYFDEQLLTAAACISPNVVAYYDGALHVAATDADLRASVLHEYTHHVLISSGLLAPAWAQEGIAMNIASETWWRERRWYTALLERPFGIDDLDESIPYKLAPDQAVLFYAQSAALVACVLESNGWRLEALFNALLRRTAASGETVGYELPEVEHASFLRGCLERWNE